MKAAVYSGTRNLYHDMVTAEKSLAANSSAVCWREYLKKYRDMSWEDIYENSGRSANV